MDDLSITVFFNTGKFKQEKYGNERVREEAAIYSTSIDSSRPNYIVMEAQENEVSDETNFLQFGFVDEDAFTTFSFSDPLPSLMDKWPTKENPYTAYKYTSIVLTYSQDK